MMKITGLSDLFKWENLHNWWLTKYFFAPLYILYSIPSTASCLCRSAIAHPYIYMYIQWGKKVFSQPPIVQVLPLKNMREACNFHHRYTSTMTDEMRKKTENHIVVFFMNLFANLQNSK